MRDSEKGWMEMSGMEFRFTLTTFLALCLSIILWLSIVQTTIAYAAKTDDSSIEKIEIQSPIERELVAVCPSEDHFLHWPLPILTKSTRIQKLKKTFEKINGYQNETVEPPTEECRELLGKLKNFSDIIILESTYTSAQKDASIPYKIAPNCNKWNLERKYIANDNDIKRTSEFFIRDPEFFQLAEADRLLVANGFIEATANFEYYDLSNYLGSNMWGYFAEGARTFTPSYKKPIYSACGPWGGGVHTIFNGKECFSIQDPHRAGRGDLLVGQDTLSYADTHSFFAFIAASGKIFRLRVQVPYLKQSKVKIFVDKVQKQLTSPAFINACSFSYSPPPPSPKQCDIEKEK